jgi:hypothetical protein
MLSGLIKRYFSEVKVKSVVLGEVR